MADDGALRIVRFEPRDRQLPSITDVRRGWSERLTLVGSRRARQPTGDGSFPKLMASGLPICNRPIFCRD